MAVTLQKDKVRSVLMVTSILYAISALDDLYLYS